MAAAQERVNATTSDFIGILNQVNPALGGYVDASLKAIKVAGGLAEQQVPVIDLVKKATTAIKANIGVLKLFGTGGALVGGVVALAAAFRAIKQEAAAARKEIEGIIKAQTALKGEEADRQKGIEASRDSTRAGPFTSDQARAAAETAQDIAGKRQFGFLDPASVDAAVVAVGGRSDQIGGGSRDIQEIARIAALIQQGDFSPDSQSSEARSDRAIDRALSRFADKLDAVFAREAAQAGAATRQAAGETRAVGGSIAGLTASAARRTAGTASDPETVAIVAQVVDTIVAELTDSADFVRPEQRRAFGEKITPGLIRRELAKRFSAGEFPVAPGNVSDRDVGLAREVVREIRAELQRAGGNTTINLQHSKHVGPDSFSQRRSMVNGEIMSRQRGER